MGGKDRLPVTGDAAAIVTALVARARAAQAAFDAATQDEVDEVVTAVGWAIVDPEHNRALSELAVGDTGLGNVKDKMAKNRRKTMGLLRDLAGVKSVGVIAEEPEHFQAWLEGQRRLANEPDEAALRHGRSVFLSSPCILCHTIRGIGAFGHKAPDLTHLRSRQTIAAATAPNSPGHLAGWVVDSQNLKPGNKMPPNMLAAADLVDLVSYLGSLR